MNAEVTDLVREDGVVCGVRYRTPAGEHAVRARLTVGADGRSSRTRERAGLRPIETAAPIDVFWFRLPRRPDEPVALAGRAAPGRFAVLIDRGDYWQVGYLIPKGAAVEIRAAGLDEFRRAVAALIPELADRVGELRDWDQVKLLTVQSNRLARWWTRGYLAIGDAAHAMSPVAGVGINVAIQDAVVAANVLWEPLRTGRITTADLAAVQRRREIPLRITQALQAFVQRRVVGVALGATTAPAVPWPLRLLARTPLLRDLPARLVGLGIGRPRIESPALAAPVGPPVREGRTVAGA
jgi:2-polyprenyl-6-methoxyphenol hydroxylase-like FAD-dependent oxidoreductase